ncbi:MAG: radical SAM protein [Butyrivibrio sp.]|nr:radical SAM protein [Butyrivibrio sp.]
MYELKSCVWELTLACCFNCKYCGSKGGNARKNELTTEECLNIVEQLSEIGCKRVALIGGEVFMRDDWDIIAKQLTSRKIRTSIITNGYRISESLMAEIDECKIESIAVSIDGTEDVHDQLRRQGSFAQAVAAIHNIAAHGIPVSVISTLNAVSALRLDELYEFLRQLPIFAWQLQACSPMGNAQNCGIDYHFDFGKVLRFVGEKAGKAPFKMGVADNIGYFTSEEGYIRGNLSGFAVFRGCGAGITSIGIDSVGNVRGCESQYDDRFIEGNLRESSLMEIWNSPNAFSYNRQFTQELLTGKCAACLHGRYCRGGCRSYNYFVHNKLYESPCCPCNDGTV